MRNLKYIIFILKLLILINPYSFCMEATFFLEIIGMRIIKKGDIAICCFSFI
ncbi:hypothetical protein FORC47_p492 (plasmid) [Bacillus cereus]|nr:hypothetical protein FORC47_p492 [Bacillus cereus]